MVVLVEGAIPHERGTPVTMAGGQIPCEVSFADKIFDETLIKGF